MSMKPKRAILYTRVSTDEQADRGYSLRDQESRLRDYCRRNHIEVVAHFQDDASAKSFDRPEFQRLLALVRSKTKEVDQVLFVKWDRFSRNATDALYMIRVLEDLGVHPQAIEQPIDRSVPEQLMMLAIYVAAPEVENQRRSLNTIMGMRRAQKEGRWTTTPPKGYRRAIDERGKAIIVPDERTADFVREAYAFAADTNMPMEAIRLQLRKKGFECSANQFTLLLRNPVYMGKVKVPAWRDEPEMLVDGLHEGLVSPALWHKVQERYQPRQQSRHRSIIPEIPARGHLLCPQCLERGESRILTGSGSKGRNGRHWYYHCRNGCRERQRAGDVHDSLERFLRSIRIARPVRDLYLSVLGDLSKEEGESRMYRLRTLEQQAKDLDEKLFQVDEKYVEGALARDSYDRLKARYGAELVGVQAQIDELRNMEESLADQLAFTVEVFSNPEGFYRDLTAEGKSEYLGSIFPEKLIYSGGRVRTAKPNPIIALFAPKSQKMNEAPPISGRGFLSGSPVRKLFEPEVSERLARISTLRRLKAA